MNSPYSRVPNKRGVCNKQAAGGGGWKTYRNSISGGLGIRISWWEKVYIKYENIDKQREQYDKLITREVGIRISWLEKVYIKYENIDKQ